MRLARWQPRCRRARDRAQLTGQSVRLAPMTYRAPVADIAFSLKHAAGFGPALEEGLYGDLAEDLVAAVLEEAGKFATDILGPLNQVGDRHGASLTEGVVTTAPGWKEAYRAWAQAGWNGLAAPAQWGGQDLPHAVNAACMEMWRSEERRVGKECRSRWSPY